MNDNNIFESSSTVKIQYMTNSGIWNTVYITQNIPIQITQAMEQTRKIFPKARIRAIDAKTGALIDKL